MEEEKKKEILIRIMGLQRVVISTSTYEVAFFRAASYNFSKSKRKKKMPSRILRHPEDVHFVLCLFFTFVMKIF